MLVMMPVSLLVLDVFLRLHHTHMVLGCLHIMFPLCPVLVFFVLVVGSLFVLFVSGLFLSWLLHVGMPCYSRGSCPLGADAMMLFPSFGMMGTDAGHGNMVWGG